MKTKLTVTIGIPAYNEEKNIANLLNSVLEQRQTAYKLEKIIVISDGSDDNTEKISTNLIKENPLIKLVADKLRLGKAKRLLQLYKMNTSDYIMQIDADTFLGTRNTINDLVRGFSNERIAVVSGNIQPIDPKTHTERLFYRWFQLWNDIKKKLKGQENIHNIHSQIIVLKKEFAKKIKLIANISSDGQYIFCFAKQKNLLFYYADDAIVYFRLPTNIHDYLLQANRTVDERKQLANLFGNWVYDLFKIPLDVKLKVLFKHLLMHPIDTFLASSLFLILRFMPQTDTQKIQNGKWQVVASTKKL